MCPRCASNVNVRLRLLKSAPRWSHYRLPHLAVRASRPARCRDRRSDLTCLAGVDGPRRSRGVVSTQWRCLCVCRVPATTRPCCTSFSLALAAALAATTFASPLAGGADWPRRCARLGRVHLLEAFAALVLEAARAWECRAVA